MAAYDQAGAITWTRDQDGARKALVDAWKRDTAANPEAMRFVFACTNKDVDALNAVLPQVRRDRGVQRIYTATPPEPEGIGCQGRESRLMLGA